MQEKLTEDEQLRIKNLFPSHTELWEKTKDLKPLRIEPGKEYVYFASICLSDFVDLLQTANSSSFNALRKYILHRRLKLNKHWKISSVFYFRYYFDYAIISLISGLNNLLAFYCYKLGSQNTPIDKYPTLDQIKNGPFKHLSFPAIFDQIVSSKKYETLRTYRHMLLHRGLPKFKGDFRQVRENPVQKNSYHNGIIGLVKEQNKGIAFFRHEDSHQFTIHSLIKSASWLHQILLKEGEIAHQILKPEVITSIRIDELF